VTPEQAFDAHHQSVFRFAYRLTRDPGLAEDIVQECFLAYLRTPGRLDPERGTVRTFLFAIARNLVFKHYRDTRDSEPLDEIAEARFSPDLAVAVEQAVASLPPLQQEAVVLFEYEGMTLEEIAQVAGCDAGTVKSRLHRARERLKRVLAPYRKAEHGTAGRS
jgi:RNA polymerase sigma-70 factor (ECF subfamily)